ncbi:hypothetical protein CDO87_05340 [Sagittula sp. P11]|nr:hypothetical protein CDO87_05340 [Sagittula sp. P11]
MFDLITKFLPHRLNQFRMGNRQIISRISTSLDSIRERMQMIKEFHVELSGQEPVYCPQGSGSHPANDRRDAAAHMPPRSAMTGSDRRP